MRTRGLRSVGLTMIEMAITATITAIALAAVLASTNRAYGTWRATVAQTELDRQVALALDRIVAQLADAGSSTIADALAAPDGGSSITFRRREGYSGSAVTWSETTTITQQADPADPANGLDDDGDGTIDEGEVVLDVTGSTPVVLVRNVAAFLDGETDDDTDENGNGLVDETGLSFERVGSRVIVRLTLTRLDADGQRVTRSGESSVRIYD